MQRPPSYEESTSGDLFDNPNRDSKEPQRFSIRTEIATSRSQHVAGVVTQLVPRLRDRARRGLSKSTLLLLPSHQGHSQTGQLIGFPEDALPVLVYLEGSEDTLEFWTQPGALDSLQNQMLQAISDGLTPSAEDSLSVPEGSMPPRPPRKTFWSRKQGKKPETEPEIKVVKSPVSVEVQLDEVHFRTENAYGLYETLRSRCVQILVDVR